MVDSAPSNIDTVLEQLRARLVEQRETSSRIVDRIKAAADAYLSAVESDLAAELASQVGMKSNRSPTALHAAQGVRDAIDGLPGVRQVEVMAPTAALAEPLKKPGFEEGTISALFSEFQALDLETVSNEMFRALAEEFACRARGFQDRGVTDTADVVGRIIRKLTALASTRNLRDVFGLKRAHQDDWSARAARARRERERLAALPAKTVATKIAIPASVKPAVKPEPEEEDHDGDGLQFPLLRGVVSDRGMVIMGGIAKAEKLERLRRHLGAGIEWLATDAVGTKGVAVLERRVSEGRVGAVVILEELIGHKHYEPIVAAARRAHVPLAYGAKAGKAMIEQALREIETMLERQSGEHSTA